MLINSKQIDILQQMAVQLRISMTEYFNFHKNILKLFLQKFTMNYSRNAESKTSQIEIASKTEKIFHGSRIYLD